MGNMADVAYDDMLNQMEDEEEAMQDYVEDMGAVDEITIKEIKMETKSDLINGIFVDRPKEGSPEFVKARISIKVEEFVKALQENVNEKGYVNLDLLKSKAGKLYVKLNKYKKAEKDAF